MNQVGPIPSPAPLSPNGQSSAPRGLSDRAWQRPRDQRGFIFLFVLMVLALCILIIGVGVQRASVQNAVVEVQLNRYKRHHEMLTIRDIVLRWIESPTNREKIIEYARKDEPAYSVVLPTGVAITVRVRDGQGTVLSRMDQSIAGQVQFRLHDIVTRLPTDRSDLTRRFGPAQLSLAGTDDDVLIAVAGGNMQLASALASLRAEVPMDSAKFMNVLSGAGFADQSSDLAQLFVFTPTLFRLEVRAVDESAARRYELLLEFEANMPRIHQWRIVPGDDTAALETDLQNESVAQRAGGSRTSKSSRTKATDSDPAAASKLPAKGSSKTR